MAQEEAGPDLPGPPPAKIMFTWREAAYETSLVAVADPPDDYTRASGSASEQAPDPRYSERHPEVGGVSIPTLVI